MRYLVLALLMFLLGALLTTFKPEDPQLIPVVRMRSPEGFYVTYVRDRTRGAKRCNDEIDLYVNPLKTACPACAIESTECAAELSGMEKALAENKPLPIYVVTAKGLRMAVVGPPSRVKVWCESVATEMVRKGLPHAACVYPPGAAPAPG